MGNGQEKNQRGIYEESKEKVSMHANSLFMYICAASLGLGMLFIVKTAATGTRGNRWSLVTIRMALAVFVRSPAA